MSQIVFTVNADLAISSWDGLLEILFSCKAEDAVGAPYHNVIPPLRCGHDDAVAKVVRDGNPLELRGYHLPWGGGTAAFDITISPSLGKQSEIVGADIRIEPSGGCAPSVNQERFQSLIDIGKVSATLAHGVRNPLNAIKGAVVYLREKYRSDRTFVEFADIIDEEIHRLDDFIAEFLSTSFMHSSMSETDLNEFVDRIAKLVALQAKSGSVEFQREFGAPPPVVIDTFNIGHAILNIINNAMEAMPDGGTLTLRTFSVQDDRVEYAVIEVSDTGVGGVVCDEMPDGSEPAWIGRGRGRGFGLFITREIVRFHGGRLQITSTTDGGTTVRVLLPVVTSGSKGNGR